MLLKLKQIVKLFVISVLGPQDPPVCLMIRFSSQNCLLVTETSEQVLTGSSKFCLMQGADSYFHLSFSLCDFFHMYVIRANLTGSSPALGSGFCTASLLTGLWALCLSPSQFTFGEAAYGCMIMLSLVWNLLVAPLLSTH